MLKKHSHSDTVIRRARVILAVSLLLLLSISILPVRPVSAVPTVFPSSLPEGEIDVYYSTTLIAASSGTGCCTWSYTGTLPPGLNLGAATGIISGTPTNAGTYTFFATATDDDGPSAPQGFFITITPPPLIFDTTSLSDATEESSYSATISVSGGTSPYTWSIVSGSLPAGLSLYSTNGSIYGAPNEGTSGTYDFTVKVTDSSSPKLSAQRAFTLIVEQGYFQSVISIGTSLTEGETMVYVNGVYETTLEGGESVTLDFDEGTNQTITVESTITDPEDSNIRYIAETDRIVVNQSSPNAQFDYDTEFYITFKTSPTDVGGISGSGWYLDGYALSTSAEDKVEDTSDTQYRFSHWSLPTGETSNSNDLSLTVSMAGNITAYYDTYYKLTLMSPYGNTGEGTWYEADTEAYWTLEQKEVSMSGILGMFGGKFIATTSSGTQVMDEPKTVAINWDSDYSRPILFISLIGLAIGLAIFFGLRRSKSPQPAAAPSTVVVIGDQSKASQTTREQLLERLSQYLERYEEEVRSSVLNKEAGELIEADSEGERMLLAAAAAGGQELHCGYTARRLLRVVVGAWRQEETGTTPESGRGKSKQAEEGTNTITWKREVYNEWEILTCSQPKGHEGEHRGSYHIVYTILNTVSEKTTLPTGEEPKPPSPHYTDGMPEVMITPDRAIPVSELPSEELPSS